MQGLLCFSLPGQGSLDVSSPGSFAVCGSESVQVPFLGVEEVTPLALIEND